MGAFFVTGSGTDIGKTFVCAALIRRLRREGRAVEALKPVVSGFDPGAPAGGDPAILLAALGRLPTEENIGRISPWRFKAPLSPDMAAAAEGRVLDAAEVTAFCAGAIAAAEGVLLIEGAGGVMAPLGARATQLDLMRALALPAIFVAGSYLGALSHALTGLEALKSRGLDVRAVVVNETPESSVALAATCATLARFTAAPVLALPRTGAAQEADEEGTVARLAALLFPLLE
jgi:dethiobiotin synthetase